MARNGRTGSRREWLRCALGTAALPLFAPRRGWSAGSASASAARLARVALVVGNGAYAASPLKNPPNDARAMGEALAALGFQTEVHLDADRATFERAIGGYTAALAERRCAGLFYYAGHGVQANWRNFLIPVDAQLSSLADLERQGLALDALMAGLARAANPLNLVILDACRNDPFADATAQAPRGLSQMDAPPGSLLAYATAPGNVASDGSGANGLYTENLLREIKVAGAKVEDVFKRVRLAVRQASHGTQIPWESTSLEGDFYFVAPADAGPADDAAKARTFAAELAYWESIEHAGRAAPFEAYLRRYPSGEFSELAQLQLDRLLAAGGEKAVRVASQAGNPYSAGTARADTAFRVGDVFRYVVYDRDSGEASRRHVERVSAITDQEVVFNDGQFVTDLLGNPRRAGDGRRYTAFQQQPTEFALGKAWITRFRLLGRREVEFESFYRYRIVGRETVSVPAGRFDCFRVEGRGESRLPDGHGSTMLVNNYWMAPEVCRRPVQWEIERVRYPRRGASRVLQNERFALEAYAQG